MQVEIRCEREVPEPHTGHLIRCQLLIGHGNRHVAMGSTDHAARQIWRWTDATDLQRNPFQSELAAGLPWAPGMPSVEVAAPGDGR